MESTALPSRLPHSAELAARPFDVLGKTYEDTYAHLPEQLAAIDWLLARLPERARVMDIGSGTGRPTAELIAEAGHEVTGYDVSTTMVELARTQVPNARFELADVRTLPDAPGRWDAITAFFPLLQMPRADLDATLTRIADWLAPGGLFVFATVPFDTEDDEIQWMGQTVRCTSYPAETYLQLLRKAGLDVDHEQTSVFHPDFPGMGAEEHLFVYARKPGGPAVAPHALAGPYPLPETYRGPHELSEQGWLGMEARFERCDIGLVADALGSNTRVLDVGGGTGAVVREIATRVASVTTVEPHAAREDSMRPLTAHGVTVLPGCAEQLPLGESEFDAVVATWVLHYTDDPDAAAAEMVRVVDRAHPEARIVIVQGAPDNELIDLWNRTCAHLVGEPRDHQGHLLTRAAHVFAEHGFDDIAFTRARVDVVFPEDGAEAKALAAADVLAEFWNTGHPRLAQLREALLPALREHFATGTDRFNDDAVMLVARPRAGRREAHAMTSTPAASTATPPATSPTTTSPTLTSAEVAAWYEASDDLCKLISGDSFHYGLWQPGDLDDPLPARELATQAQNRMTDLFCDLLDLTPGRHLLDVGCGHGSPALHAARQRGLHVTGCSISRTQITEATRRATAAGLTDQVRFGFGDAMDLPHDSARFDAAWALDSFPHLDDPVKGLRELARVTRPGAPVLVTFYTQRVPATDAELTMCRDAFAFCPLPTHDQVLDHIRSAELTLEHTRDLTEHIAPTADAYTRIYRDNRPLVADRFGTPFADAMDTTLDDTLTFLTDKTGYLACLLRTPAHR